MPILDPEKVVKEAERIAKEVKKKILQKAKEAAGVMSTSPIKILII
jgi:hypothetical protein